MFTMLLALALALLPASAASVAHNKSARGRALSHCMPDYCGYCEACPTCYGGCMACCAPRPSPPPPPHPPQSPESPRSPPSPPALPPAPPAPPAPPTPPSMPPPPPYLPACESPGCGSGSQWAESANASSQFSTGDRPGSGSAWHATGKIGTSTCGGAGTVWQPFGSAPEPEWLTVTFTFAVWATKIEIFKSLPRDVGAAPRTLDDTSPKLICPLITLTLSRPRAQTPFIKRVEVIDPYGVATTVWNGTDFTPCGDALVVSLLGDLLVKHVTIHTQARPQDPHPGQIDAVRLTAPGPPAPPTPPTPPNPPRLHCRHRHGRRCHTRRRRRRQHRQCRRQCPWCPRWSPWTRTRSLPSSRLLTR